MQNQMQNVQAQEAVQAPVAQPMDPKYCQPMQANIPVQQEVPQHPHHHSKPRPKRHRFRRFMGGYLMIVGALVNIFVLSQLLLLLLEFMGTRFSMV